MIGKRIRRNLAASVADRLLAAVKQIVLVPVLLHAWGVDYYGVWIMLTAVPTILALSNLGMGTASAVELSHRIAAGKEESVKSLLATAMGMIALVMTTVTLGSAWIAVPLMEWFEIPIGVIDRPVAAVTLLFASVTVSTLAQPLEGLWVGRQRAATIILLSVVRQAVEIAGMVAAVMLGAKAVGLAGTILGVNLGWAVLVLGWSRRLLPATGHWRIDRSSVREMFLRGTGFQASAVWQALLFQGSLLLTGSLAGPGASAALGTLRTISRVGTQALSILNQSTTPELQTAYGRRDLATCRRLHAVGLVVAGGAATAGSLLLVLAGPLVYRLWTNSAIEVPGVVWPLLALGVIGNACWWTSATVLRSANRAWTLNGPAVLAALLALGLMAALNPLGLGGLIGGLVFFELAMAVWVARQSFKLLDDGLAPCLRRGVEELRLQVRRVTDRFGVNVVSSGSGPATEESQP